MKKYTLIEFLVVVAIIAIIAAMIVPIFMPKNKSKGVELQAVKEEVVEITKSTKRFSIKSQGNYQDSKYIWRGIIIVTDNENPTDQYLGIEGCGLIQIAEPK